MVDEILVKQDLTREMIDAGARLVDRLNGMDLRIKVAMWFFVPEGNKWRLLISTPLEVEAGPGEVYDRIEKARMSLDEESAELLFWAVGLLNTRDEVVEAIASGIPVGGTAKPVRFRGVVRGRYVDDVLVYHSAA